MFTYVTLRHLNQLAASPYTEKSPSSLYQQPAPRAALVADSVIAIIFLSGAALSAVFGATGMGSIIAYALGGVGVTLVFLDGCTAGYERYIRTHSQSLPLPPVHKALQKRILRNPKNSVKFTNTFIAQHFPSNQPVRKMRQDEGNPDVQVTQEEIKRVQEEIPERIILWTLGLSDIYDLIRKHLDAESEARLGATCKTIHQQTQRNRKKLLLKRLDEASKRVPHPTALPHRPQHCYISESFWNQCFTACGHDATHYGLQFNTDHLEPLEIRDTAEVENSLDIMNTCAELNKKLPIAKNQGWTHLFVPNGLTIAILFDMLRDYNTQREELGQPILLCADTNILRRMQQEEWGLAPVREAYRVFVGNGGVIVEEEALTPKRENLLLQEQQHYLRDHYHTSITEAKPIELLAVIILHYIKSGVVICEVPDLERVGVQDRPVQALVRERKESIYCRVAGSSEERNESSKPILTFSTIPHLGGHCQTRITGHFTYNLGAWSDHGNVIYISGAALRDVS